MLPTNDDLVRAMAHRTTRDAERLARDRGFLRDARESAFRLVRPAQPSRRHTGSDCLPCPPTASERARGLAG
jgi:hypothetical protein